MKKNSLTMPKEKVQTVVKSKPIKPKYITIKSKCLTQNSDFKKIVNN